MEGHRYAEDQPSWYPGQANPYDSGVHDAAHERPSGAFRLPEQRPAVAPPAGPYAMADPLTTTGSHARPVRGPEYPTIRPPEEPRPAAADQKERRPVSAFLVAIIMFVLFIPVFRLLIDQAFTGDPTAAGIVPAVLLTLGFALTGIGLFALARNGGATTRDSWLTPPVAYVPVGLILLLAAGLAVA
ncbi:hypothetical protein [Paractinoplanes durhamensis]|uniref:hypothetical protein n=1 Tax=Paractinoplanes durhamensis TaxID=113563 RepID=UPI0019424DC5|nr:hypothetical protein [Actinoplanes durhamensis]